MTNIRESLLATQRDVLEARKCENINDPIDTHVIDQIAMVWSHLFIRLNIVPNAVTMLSMISGVAGGMLLALNGTVWMDLLGALLVIHAVIFDSSDGQVARLTKHYSPLGRILDGLSDAAVHLSLYLACILRAWGNSPLSNEGLWHCLLLALLPTAYLLYIVQSQLPDYFKNLHMFMVDTAHCHEMDRARDVLEKYRSEPRGSFSRVSLFFYYRYTYAQERRAPRTQKLLDAIAVKGKNEELCDAFYAKSRVLVKRTNLLTVNLRIILLLLCVFLHVEPLGLLVVLVVLEPIRWILLWKYEQLSESLLPLV